MGSISKIEKASMQGDVAGIEEAQIQLMTRRNQLLGDTRSDMIGAGGNSVYGGYLAATPEAQRRRQQAISRIGTAEDLLPAQRQAFAALPEEQRKQVELLNGLLAELKALREQAEATKRANERTADALTIAPGAGASAAAAQPPVQRLGR